MKKHLVNILLLFCILAFGCSQNDEKEAQKYYDLANSLLDKEDLGAALDKIDSAIILDKTNLKYRTLRGDILCQSNQFDKGISDFNYVLDQDSMDYESRDLRALANMISGFTSKSVNDHKFLIKNYPDSVGPYIGLAMIYNNTQQWDSAIYYLNKGKEMEPDRKGIYSQLATLYHLRKDYNKSIEILNEAFNKGIATMEMLNLRGYNYILTENFSGAKEDFQIILDSKFDDIASLYLKSLAMNNMGFVEYKNKNYDVALDWINKSLAENPNNGFAYRNKALVYIDLNDIPSACENLRQADNLRDSSYDIDDLDDLMDKYCK